MTNPSSEQTPATRPRFPACPKCCLRALCLAGPVGDSPPARATVLRRHRHVPRGGYLFRTGEPFHAVCALCTGAIKLCALTDEGVARVVGFHLPGELVGLSGLAQREHRYDALALEDSVVCEIPFARLETAAEERPALRRSMMHCLSSELARNEARLAALVGRKSAAARLAACLFALSERFAERGFPAECFPLAMSRADLGDYLGLAKETVSRLFARFQHEGLVRLEARVIHLCDLPRLARIAEGGD
jgi:CRP/FNR family transcriptional regulator